MFTKHEEILSKILASVLLLIMFSPVFIPAGFVLAEGESTQEAETGLVPCGTLKDSEGNIQNPCKVCHLMTGIKGLVDWGVNTLAVPVAVAMVVYGGVMMTVAGVSTNPGNIEKGRNAIKYAIEGMVIVFAAWLIVDTILKALLSGGTGNIVDWGPWNQIPPCN